MRYLGVWLTSEGSCIITGLSYNGKTPQGELIWDGLRNIKLSLYERSYTYQHIVECFNLNTNKWVFRYFFKRLRFLGNKDLSHFLTLMFLAIWHGLHVGYFICFTMEFLIIMMERQVYNLCAAIFKVRWADMGTGLKALALAFAWPIRFCGFGYCIIPFHFLTWSAMKGPLHATYYLVPSVLAVWFTIYPIIIHPIYKSLTRTPSDQPRDKERLKKAE
ncbi:Lysophospholipid acyltransferase 5 [Exaiptasia diaphana]|nr:Lysophospholipid acyltransferase 5 [Exaiptasia diaphana]